MPYLWRSFEKLLTSVGATSSWPAGVFSVSLYPAPGRAPASLVAPALWGQPRHMPDQTLGSGFPSGRVMGTISQPGQKLASIQVLCLSDCVT